MHTDAHGWGRGQRRATGDFTAPAERGRPARSGSAGTSGPGIIQCSRSQSCRCGPEGRAPAECGRPARSGSAGASRPGIIQHSRSQSRCCDLECGDLSPLWRRRLVAVEVPGVSTPECVPALARALSAPFDTCANGCSTATSRLAKAVTSHRTPHAKFRLSPCP